MPGDPLALATVAVPREWTDRGEVLKRIKHYGRIDTRHDHSTVPNLLGAMLAHGFVEVRAKHLGLIGEEYRLAERVQQETPVDPPKDRNTYENFQYPPGHEDRRSDEVKFVRGTPEAEAERIRCRRAWRDFNRSKFLLDD